MDLRTLAPVFFFVVCVGNVQSSGYSSSRRNTYSGSIPAGFRVRYVARGTAGQNPSTSQQRHSGGKDRQAWQLRGPNVCSPNRCCPGWKINTSTRTCTTPRCAFKCLHGGICVRPNRCSCQSGYRGVACHIAPRSYGKSTGRTGSSPDGQRPTGTAEDRTLGPVQPKRRGDGFEAQAYTSTGGRQLYSVGRQRQTVSLGSNGQITHLQEGQGRQRITLTPGQSVSFVGGESHRVVSATAGQSVPLRPGQKVTIVGLTNRQGLSGSGARSGTRESEDQRSGVRVSQIVGTGGRQQTVTLPDGRTVSLAGFRVSSPGGVALPMAAQVGGSGLLGKQSTDPLAGEGSLSGVTVVGQQNVRGMCYGDIKGRQCVDPLGGKARVTQAECCKTFGKGWGDSCFMCPHMLGQVDGCPAGHQRNQTTGGCADIDECKAFPGLCENGRCTNNPGSFHCSCRVGYMLDATGTRCIAESRGRCYKETSGECGVDLTGLSITKHVCCCTIGESWGPQCERCPDPNSQNFKWLCPGGLGFQRRTAYIGGGGRTDEQTRTDQVVDFDECSTMVNICQYGRCFNTIGSYYCLCNPGYRLEGSRTKCVAIPTRTNCDTTIGLCPNGRCINFRDSYVCNCDSGYQYDPREKTCIERPRSICETMLNLCPNGRCRPSGNSYTCVCNPGYKLDQVRKTCVVERTVSVCESRPGVCRNGRCVDSRGSYLCMCNPGYRQDLGGRACADINECSYRNGRCHHGTCVNTEGSFTCRCDDGYKLSPDRKSCIDLDECPSQTTCTSPNQCLNFMGSYYCMCSAGYRHHGDNTKACIEEEINECAIDPSLCQNGECINTRGSFVCRCDTGYKTDDTMTQCLDEDECQLDPSLCPNGRCYNNEGSYVCACDRGYRIDASRTQCLDVDECEANSKLCRDGECVNTPGGYRCRCDQGYIPSPDQRACVDVDECSIGNPCGQSVCQNLPGHFTCVCTQGLVFDEDTQRCMSAWLAEQRQSRKQCFSELKDLDFGCADNPAGFNVTKEECCCSLGVAWGDSCELFPCPSRNAADYLELCATLSGFLMKHDQNNEIYIEDINECELFNNPCNNAICRNTPGSYVCICPDGYFLNEQELTCTDINECAQFPCGSGTCLNLPGSYECSCLGNQIPDPTKKRCIERPLTLPLEPPAASYTVFEPRDVCWTSVIGPNLFCSNALPFNMTRAQCCCRSDVQAWGVDCRLCPKLGTDAFRDLCERIKPGTSVDQHAFYMENIGPVAGQVPLIPGQQPGLDRRPGWLGPYAGGAPPGRIPPAQLPPGILAPRQGHPSAAYVPSEARTLQQGYASETLDADCKIKGGCGFGRCLRVDGGGYICDCYSGYKLDNKGLKCVDMNECEELGDLCRNGTCINTAGSYICHCHPGHAPKPDQPNFCVEQQNTEPPTQDSLSRTEE
ncbi:uncharacterized protein LOC144871519 isoform X1 [Branchiostoma floridae x Branchiostoma japonicum]